MSWTYVALDELDGLTQALETPTSGDVLAARDPSGTRVGVALAADGGETCTLLLERLPWAGPTRLVRWEVTDAGLRRAAEQVLAGPVRDAVTAPAEGAVVVCGSPRRLRIASCAPPTGSRRDPSPCASRAGSSASSPTPASWRRSRSSPSVPRASSA